MSFQFAAFGQDRFVLAKTIYGEARGESQEGQIAVGWTVRNRAQHVLDNGGPAMFGTGTLATAAQYPWQYSCWNSNSSEAEAMAAIIPGNDDPIFQDCLAVADLVISGAVDDPTFKSLWYHDTSMGFPSAWGAEVPPACQIGRLIFYNHLAS